MSISKAQRKWTSMLLGKTCRLPLFAPPLPCWHPRRPRSHTHLLPVMISTFLKETMTVVHILATFYEICLTCCVAPALRSESQALILGKTGNETPGTPQIDCKVTGIGDLLRKKSALVTTALRRLQGLADPSDPLYGHRRRLICPLRN